jgi:hypothetical protein
MLIWLLDSFAFNALTNKKVQDIVLQAKFFSEIVKMSVYKRLF